jgi:hypothetical protein
MPVVLHGGRSDFFWDSPARPLAGLARILAATPKLSEPLDEAKADLQNPFRTTPRTISGGGGDGQVAI